MNWVDKDPIWQHNKIIANKERMMLRLIGIGAVLYVGWVTGVIQAALLITAAGLTTIAAL